MHVVAMPALAATRGAMLIYSTCFHGQRFLQRD